MRRRPAQPQKASTAARGRTSPSRGESGDEGSIPRVVIQLLSAGAGIVLFIYLIGGVIARARLQALELPTDTVIQLLPREALIVMGLSGLRIAIVMAVVIALTLWWLGDRAQAGWRGLTHGRWTVGAILVVGTGISALTSRGTGASYFLPLVAAVAVALLLVVAITGRRLTVRQTALGVIAVAAVLGGVVAYLRESEPPVALDYAVLQLRDGARTTGYLIATTSDAVLIAPDVERYTIHRVSAVPRSQIVELLIRRPTWKARPESALRRDPRFKDRNRLDYLTDTRGSTVWKYPPTMLPQSIARWGRESASFAGLVVARATARSEAVADLADLSAEPFVFDGVTVLVRRARVVAVARRVGGIERSKQAVILAQPGDPGVRAVCQAGRASPTAVHDAIEPVRRGQTLSLRVLAIASGVVVDGSGQEYRRLVLACGQGRLVKDT
jgi:hypothetical protein